MKIPLTPGSTSPLKGIKHREGNRRRRKKMYMRRIAAKLCVRCGQPSVDGLTVCGYHRDLPNSDVIGNRRRCRDKRDRRIAAGLCVRCVLPALSGKTLCSIHRDQYKADAIVRKSEIAAYKRSIREIENARKRSPQCKAHRQQLRRESRLNNPKLDMADRLRKRIGRAIRDYGTGRKSASSALLLGCSMPEFMAHLESRFLPGMTWENRNQWHVDHKRPARSFDLSDPAQQLACFHFSNLQPLWAVDNIRKHAKWVPPLTRSINPLIDSGSNPL